MHSIKDKYRKMNEEFGERKARGYVDAKFYPGHPVGLKNFLREKMLLHMLNASKADKVLDVGCASGRQSFLIAEKRAEVTGIDISNNFVKQATSSVKKYGANNISFMVADIESLPFPPDHFDKILCAEILEHVLNLDDAMNQLLGVLKPGGLLVISVPNENGKGTLWQRVKTLILKERFSPLEDFSLQGIERHGDAHLRIFNQKTITGFLRLYPLDILAIRGCDIIDFPLYDRVLGILLISRTFRTMWLKTELVLAQLGIMKLLSRHLVLSAIKRI
ncbi:class I SAM-dependent methyltransferase [Chloroflexota bacterium]